MVGSLEIAPRLSEWISRIHADDAAGVCSALEAHISGNTPELEVEYRLRHSDGSYRKMRTHARAVRDAAGRAFRVSGVQTDLSVEPGEDAPRREKRGRKGSGDEETTLVDRGTLIDRLAGAMARAGRRGGSTLAVLAVSLDRWERINERLGLEAGERMLLTAARRIAAGMRAGDTVARLNGDGFAVLLEEVESPNEAIAVAERIHRDLEQPFDLAGSPAVATASIGIALGSPDYEQPEDLVKDATAALRVARNQGGACHEIFKPSMRDGGSFA
jgi:diguanylate cyclase (GGDEF)-like protein